MFKYLKYWISWFITCDPQTANKHYSIEFLAVCCDWFTFKISNFLVLNYQ